MRVTNSMLVSKYMNNLHKNLSKQDTLLNQMANNRKVSHYSEDPISYVYSQAARQKLDRLEGYQAMVYKAQDWTTQAETGIMDLNKVLVSAYESCLDASTDIKSEGDKKNVSEYLKQLRDQLLNSLNTSFGDKFVFGGYNTVGHREDGKTVAPFTVDETTGNLMFNGCDLMDPANASVIERLSEDVLSLDVGPGVSMPITINGIRIAMIPEVKIPVFDADGNPVYDLSKPVLDESNNPVFDEKGKQVYEQETKTVNNIYNLLDELYKAAQAGWTADSLSDTFVTPLQDSQRQMLSLTAEIGGRTNRLDMLESRYADDEIAYIQMKSNAEDADQAELIMNYKMAESIYKAALAVGSYVIKPTLMDFLG